MVFSSRVNWEETTLLIDETPMQLPKDWGKYVDEPVTEKELTKLRRSVIRQSPYGDSSWEIQIGKELGLESTLRPRGRPEKMNRGKSSLSPCPFPGVKPI